MRTLVRSRHKMKFALYDSQIPVYEYYVDRDGNKIRLETGEYKAGYKEVTEFEGNIAFSGGEVQAQEFGYSVSDYDATLITPKNAYPLTETTLIWYNEEPTYTDEEVDERSATFRVIAYKPSDNVDKYLLRKVTK